MFPQNININNHNTRFNQRIIKQKMNMISQLWSTNGKHFWWRTFFLCYSLLALLSHLYEYLLILRLTRRFQILLRPLGSTPLVGSSRITALESPAKARATQRRRCIPPEREDTTASWTCHRSTSCNSLKQSHVAILHMWRFYILTML